MDSVNVSECCMYACVNNGNGMWMDASCIVNIKTSEILWSAGVFQYFGQGTASHNSPLYVIPVLYNTVSLRVFLSRAVTNKYELLYTPTC